MVPISNVKIRENKENEMPNTGSGQYLLTITKQLSKKYSFVKIWVFLNKTCPCNNRELIDICCHLIYTYIPMRPCELINFVIACDPVK